MHTFGSRSSFECHWACRSLSGGESRDVLCFRYSPEAYELIVSTSILVTIPVCLFLFIVGICLTNLLVAQLSQSYHDAYSNMQGYARLNRASITNTTVQGISVKRWNKFLSSLKLDEALEFNEGDVGLSGVCLLAS